MSVSVRAPSGSQSSLGSAPPSSACSFDDDDDDSSFQFTPPPECPVFRPSAEEWRDPLAYINRIRPTAEQSGIAKIIPPRDWQPPFAINLDTFKFTPRVQKINDLDARARVRLLFLEKLARFHDLQGARLRIPTLEGRRLDLHKLHTFVQREGGFEKVSREGRWGRIQEKMGYKANKANASTLKSHYEKILFPYDVFLSGVLAGDESERGEKAEEAKGKSGTGSWLSRNVSDARSPSVCESVASAMESDAASVASASASTASTCAGICPKPGRRPTARRMGSLIANKSCCPAPVPVSASWASRSRDSSVDTATTTASVTTPSKRVSARGAGAAEKRAREGVEEEDEEVAAAAEKIPEIRRLLESSPRKSTKQEDVKPCFVCGRADNEKRLLQCQECADAYHTYCLIAPVGDALLDEWRCPKCVAAMCARPPEAYGFEQSEREYSLQSFGARANDFKERHFGVQADRVPLERCEREFWRLVQSDEPVAVEYGADLHVIELGSGFPCKPGASTDEELQYANSAWNLNNLSVQDRSLLRYINGDISGMKVPWCYVGMCFSCFCWHTEDHWSYSINYLHWGEAKTWYGVPASDAEKLEAVMQRAAGELFAEYPDIMHQLTVTLNPNVLMAAGVRVVRAFQRAGEFVITFPRSYHAGFNQGFNFAEAVNFLPPDWISMGRKCVDHYKDVCRQCVFSHDELIWKMAGLIVSGKVHDAELTRYVLQDMLSVLPTERRLRRELEQQGLVESKQVKLTDVTDDVRECYGCKTTLFLSGLICPHHSDRIVCLSCADKLCKNPSCPVSKRALLYASPIGELDEICRALEKLLAEYDEYAQRVQNLMPVQRAESKPALSPTGEVVADSKPPASFKIDTDAAKELLDEGMRRFPDLEDVKRLRGKLSDAEKYSNVAAQFLTRHTKSTRQARVAGAAAGASGINTLTISTSNSTNRVKIDELKFFLSQCQALCFQISNLSAFAVCLPGREYVKHLDSTRAEVLKMVSCEQFMPCETLQAMLEQTYALCNEEIDLSVEFLLLKQLLDRMHWSADLCKAFKLDKLGVSSGASGGGGSGSTAKASATSFAAVSRSFSELLNQLSAFSKQTRQQSSASGAPGRGASGSLSQSPQLQVAPPRAADCYCSLQQLCALTESGLQLAENPLVTVTSPLTLDYVSLPGTKFMKTTLEQLRLLQLTCERLENEASVELPQRTKEGSASSVSSSGSIRTQLARIEELAVAADALPVYLPAVERLRDISSRAADTFDGLANICDPKSSKYAYLEYADDQVLRRVNGLALTFNFKSDPQILEQKKDIEARVTAAREWKERAAAAFLKRPGSSPVSLLECLLPRNRGNLLRSCELGPRGRRGRQTPSTAAASGSSPSLGAAAADSKSGGAIATSTPVPGAASLPDVDSSASTPDVTMTPTDSPTKPVPLAPATSSTSNATIKEELPDPDSSISSLLSWLEKNNAFNELYARKYSYEDPKHTADIKQTYGKMAALEIAQMRELRSKNVAKTSSDSTETLYCACRKPNSGLMMQCELCKDWFHDLCVKLPDRWGNIDMQTASKIREFCFLCPQCCYTKRPGLSVIVVLLQGLQPLRLRMLEGEALQNLTERALELQDSACKLLSNPDLVKFCTEFDEWKNGRSTTPVQLPAEALLQRLESLLLEAFLLEIQLEETDALYQMQLKVVQLRSLTSMAAASGDGAGGVAVLAQHGLAKALSPSSKPFLQNAAAATATRTVSTSSYSSSSSSSATSAADAVPGRPRRRTAASGPIGGGSAVDTIDLTPSDDSDDEQVAKKRKGSVSAAQSTDAAAKAPSKAGRADTSKASLGPEIIPITTVSSGPSASNSEPTRQLTRLPSFPAGVSMPSVLSAKLAPSIPVSIPSALSAAFMPLQSLQPVQSTNASPAQVASAGAVSVNTLSSHPLMPQADELCACCNRHERSTPAATQMADE